MKDWQGLNLSSQYQWRETGYTIWITTAFRHGKQTARNWDPKGKEAWDWWAFGLKAISRLQSRKRRLKQIPTSHWREDTNWDSGRWRQPEWEAACSKSRSYSKKGLQKSRKRSLGLWLENNLHVQGKAEIPRVKNSKERNITGELRTEQLSEFTQDWTTLQFPPIKAKRPHGTHRTFRRDCTGPCLKRGVNLI